MDLLTSLASFIVALGILITVHEMGHFLVAKHLGVKVLRFSVGFGRPLWLRRAGPDATEYVLAAVPLGGYVKMLDEREGTVPAAERHRAFNRQPLWVRFAVVVAGPVFNFVFAVFAYWLMFVIGVSGLRPYVDEVVEGTVAARAGLQAGDEIISAGGAETVTWERVMQVVVSNTLEGEPVVLELRDLSQRLRRVELDLTTLHMDDIARDGFFEQLGVRPLKPRVAPVIGRVEVGGPAERDGLLPGDLIVAADGTPIEGWRDWVDYVRDRPETAIRVEVMRGGVRLAMDLRPARVEDGGTDIGRIGAAVRVPEEQGEDLYARERYGPLPAVGRALDKTWEVSALTLRMLWKMLLLEVSVENLSGPISIAQYAGHSAKIGLSRFLDFLGIVSVSLGILNLLPIPLLDGGHLMYYLIELLRGRPVSEDTQLLGQRMGLAVLLGLMGLAFFNDLVRLFG